MFRELETKRLKLRTLRETDAESIYNYRKDKSNFPYVEMNEYQSLDEAINYITKVNEFNEWKVYGIELKDEKTLIGTLSIWNFNKDRTRAEIGYGLFKEYRGNGYMKEAIDGLLEYSFTDLLLENVEAYTSIENKKSNNMLKKCGFTFIKTITEDSPSNGEQTTMNVYSIAKL